MTPKTTNTDGEPRRRGPLKNPKRGALSTAVADQLADLDPKARGLAVWQWLSMREPRLWPSLVAELDNDRRLSLVLSLLCQGHASITIANKLGLMPNAVKDVWRDYAERIGTEVLGTTLPQLVGRIEAQADAFIEMSIASDRPDRAWKIAKERVELLQDLGVIERAAKRYEISHAHTLKSGDDVDAETKMEVDRILDLERKRRDSEERVKRINARVLDHIPEIETSVAEDTE